MISTTTSIPNSKQANRGALNAALPQKSKSNKPKHKKNAKKLSSSEAAPNVKFPTSKTEASTNWKLLLSNKSAEIAARKKEVITAKPANKPTFLRRDVKRHKRQLMEQKSDEASSSLSADCPGPSNVNANLDEAIRSTDKLQITSTSSSKGANVSTSSSSKTKEVPTSFPKLTGLNSLGCFDYTHYGHLKTPVLPEEHEFLTRPTPALAIDCEMVGVGPFKEDALARVSIVNEFGYCLYDKFVKPKLPVTDYRTEFSGVREEDLKNAEDFMKVLQCVAELIKGRTLVGHSLKSDFDVLLLKHPKNKIRDTSFYYRKKFKRLKTPSLKSLVKDHLKVEIQKGEHNSITDAQAAMKLYLIARDEWEDSCSQKYNYRVHQYWMGKEYRKAFQAIGFVIQIKKKERK